MKTRLQKYFRAGWSAKLSSIEGYFGTLYQDSDGRWYIFSNNSKMNGSEPSDWDKVRGGNSYSYWICDKDMEESTYEIELDYAFDDRAEKEPEPVKTSFNPKIGDTLHIMSQADLRRYTSKDELGAGGSYFGHTLKVTSFYFGHTLKVTSFYEDTAVYGIIYDSSGRQVLSNWGVYLTDFYEYYGINKSFTESYASVPGPSLSFRTMDIYASSDSIKQEGARCTLPHTSDWQIAGDSVPRKKATDMLLILGL